MTASHVISIRTATPDDLDTLVAIHSTSWYATYQENMADFCHATPPSYFRKTWENHFAQNEPRNVHLVAEKDGQAIGILRAGPADTRKINQLRENGIAICDDQRVGELYQIYLTPDAQGHRLGYGLFQEAQHHLHPHFDSMLIDVYAENKHALHFYERIGAPVALRYNDEEHRALGDGSTISFTNPSVLCYRPDLMVPVQPVPAQVYRFNMG